MTSSMLTGEKRWVSARRGGMTVLGKVAVPKPINLPSQRLENHGLDPNVEIVPKGTHSWGSRSSSSSSNAWGSSSLSPNTDGGTSSPSHLSGRPSSGGTGTRPSTAGSERAHDPIATAWGSNSRPSSSSGANQTSHPALRPRSAETRPGSSQLSRFAEPLSDNSVAWGGTRTAEKLGVTSSKIDGFTLTSEDFPTFGSKKDNSGKNIDSQDYASHGHPGSSAGLPSGKEGTRDSAGDVSVNVNTKIGAADSWRKENSMYAEDGARSNAERWHGDPQPYPNSNIPPQHYDAWHGPPVNNHPGGVWYRGPPGGPPFESPVAPGGFPMEPIPYYRPQIPPPALANPQPFHRPGAGPRGPHPKNGDMYRPHMHDAYIQPGMPLRPGFYPGPIPYDGYYGPPMGYCNSNERDASFMGMAMGPSAYNRYPGQNINDPGNSHGRTSGYGSSSKAMFSEQMEAVHPQDSRGPYKALLKQHDSWEGNEEEQKWDDSMKINAPYPLKGGHQRKSSWENELRADNKKDDEMDARRMVVGEGASSEADDNQVVPMKVKSPEHVGNMNANYDSSGKKFEHTASTSPEVSTAPKDSSLIQKIEGLNAKARASDGRQEFRSVSSRRGQNNKSQVGSAMARHSTNEVGFDSLSHEKTLVSGIINSAPHEERFSAGDKNLESAVVSETTISRISTHGLHGRADHRSRGRLNTPEADGWRKKSQILDPQNVASNIQNEISSVSYSQHRISAEAGLNSGSQPSGKDDVDSMPLASDSSDSQRTKMRELAKRLKQREQEEEERTREQRAKALAKLEELNRRTLAGEGVTQKLENVPTSAVKNRKDESLNLGQLTVVGSKSGAPSSSLGPKTNTNAQSRHEESSTAASLTVVTGKSRPPSSAQDSSPSICAQSSENSVDRVEKFTSVASSIPLETPKTAWNESVVVHEQLKSFQQDGNNADGPHCSSTQVQDSSISKKRTGYRQKHNASNSSEKSFSASATDASKAYTDIATGASKAYTDIATDAPPSESVAVEFMSNCESNSSVILSATAESSAHSRWKNKSGKNKHKVEEASSATSSPSTVSKVGTSLDTLVECVQPKTSETMLNLSSDQSQIELNSANKSSELQSSSTNEETHIRVNNQSKSHHARRMVRSQQFNRSAEKSQSGDSVVWAPVRPHNKTEVSVEANQNTVIDSVVLSLKSDQPAQNNPRNKRAEIERYIRKPVAKELSQQAVIPLTNQITSDDYVERPGSGGAESSISGRATGKVGPTMESRNGDGRQNKSGKVHGSWRQRGIAESPTNLSRSFPKSTEDHQHQKPDVSSMKEQPRHPDEWNAVDGWGLPDNPDTAVNLPVLKDQGVVARGKRQPHKGHRAKGYNHNPDEKKTGDGDAENVYVQSTAPEMHQIDSSGASKENHVGERSTSHGQPKSLSISPTIQRGTRPNSSGNVGPEGGRVSKKESSQGSRGLLPQPDKDIFRPHSNHDHPLPERSNLEEGPAVGHQEPKWERKIGQRGRHGSPIESSSHSNMDVRQEQRMASGFRKSGNSINCSVREQESRGDWNGPGKDNKQQHNVPAIRERQRHNSHYEYQPVGPHNSNKFESPKDGSHNSGGRYRERGQARRGGRNLYGRQTGGIQVDAGHE